MKAENKALGTAGTKAGVTWLTVRCFWEARQNTSQLLMRVDIAFPTDGATSRHVSDSGALWLLSEPKSSRFCFG